MQVIGKLEEIHDLVQRSETFSVREFVLEISSPTSQYTEHVIFQTTNQRTAMLDQFQIGQEIVVDFDLQGRKWTNPEGRIVFFNRLNAWRITRFDATQQYMQGGYQQQTPGYQQYQHQPTPSQNPQSMPQAKPDLDNAPISPNIASMGNNSDDLPF